MSSRTPEVSLLNMLNFQKRQSAYLALAAVSVALVSLLIALGLVFSVWNDQEDENSLYRVLNILIIVGATGITALVAVYLKAIKDLNSASSQNGSNDFYCWQPTGIIIDIADDAVYECVRGTGPNSPPPRSFYRNQAMENYPKNRLMQEVPVWAPPKYEDLQKNGFADGLPYYDQIKKGMERNKLEFLQHND